MSAIIKKISHKTVCGDLKKIVLAGIALKDCNDFENGKVFPVMSVIGSVKKVTSGEHDQYGTYYEFGGIFEATALCGENKGESFRSSKCFLPETATELLNAEYERVAEENGGEVTGIQIAFEIRAQVNVDVAQMYQFQVIPLMEAVEDDPLAMLKKQIASNQKVLEKPVDAPAKNQQQQNHKK